MQNLPVAEVYEKEFKYMPWGILVEEILDIIKELPSNFNILDLLCGPGYLLGKIKNIRPDLKLHGVDLNPEFIEFAKAKYNDINFTISDVQSWESENKFDVILITGGVHHLHYQEQEKFISKVSNLLKLDGFAIIADPYINDYNNEEDRKISAAKLGYEYMAATIKNGADDDIVKACIDIMYNDVMSIEFKNSIKKMEPILKKYFKNIELHKTWPKEETEYGDYYFVVRN